MYVPIEVHGNDEIAELGNAFNTMSVDVRQSREHETLFVQRTVDATESERMHLAAELHDGPIQRLTGLLYGLERVGTRIERGELDGLAGFLKDARTKVSSEVGALRHLLSELRPPVLAERGLGEAVRDYLSDFAQREGVEYEADVRLEERVSDSLETTMYRILQEALANITKHAGAHRVGVSLWHDGESVRMTIADDGCGFDADSRADAGGEHFGIAGMVGRARYSGGSVEIESAPGQGTTVSAALPTGRTPRRAPGIAEKVAS